MLMVNFRFLHKATVMETFSFSIHWLYRGNAVAKKKKVKGNKKCLVFWLLVVNLQLK
jgi:hypothetical protein